MGQIKNRYTGEIMCGGLSLQAVLERHQKWLNDEEGGERANLTDANLASTNMKKVNLASAIMEGSDMSGANLTGANLMGTNMRKSNMNGSDMSGANMMYANLAGADLRKSDMRYANVIDTNMKDANLAYTNMWYANIKYARMRDADLKQIKEDLFEKLKIAKNEAVGLYDHIIRGKIDGSCYETVAKLRKEDYERMSIDLKPNLNTPTEKWFTGISQGDTPDNNQVSSITAEWLREFMDKEDIKYPQYRLISSDEWPEGFKI